MHLLGHVTILTVIISNTYFVNGHSTCIDRRNELSETYIDCLKYPKKLPAKRVERCERRLSRAWRRLSRNRPKNPAVCPVEPPPGAIIDLAEVCKDASLDGEGCKELYEKLIELSTGGSTSPVECPCAFDLKAFTKHNLDVDKGSCSGDGYPNGASIGSTKGAFNSASIFDRETDEGFCVTSKAPPQIITVKETRACIQDIADRCAVLGRPIRK